MPALATILVGGMSVSYALALQVALGSPCPGPAPALRSVGCFSEEPGSSSRSLVLGRRVWARLLLCEWLPCALSADGVGNTPEYLTMGLCASLTTSVSSHLCTC